MKKINCEEDNVKFKSLDSNSDLNQKSLNLKALWEKAEIYASISDSDYADKLFPGSLFTKIIGVPCNSGVARSKRPLWVEEYGTVLFFLNADAKGDADGFLSEKDTEQFMNASKDSIYNYLQTCGVVGALILSIITPMVTTSLTPSDESQEYFGSEVLLALTLCYRIFTLTSFYLSAEIVLSSFFNFTALSHYLTVDRQKVDFLSKPRVCQIYGYVAKCHFIVLFLVLSIPFAVSINTSPLEGLLAAISAAIFTVWGILINPWKVLLFSAESQFQLTKVLCQIRSQKLKKGVQ